MLQKQMRCQIKAESVLFATMYKSQKVTFPTCSGFCGSGSQNMCNPIIIDITYFSGYGRVVGRRDITRINLMSLQMTSHSEIKWVVG